LVPTSLSTHSMFLGRPFVSHVLIKFTQMCTLMSFHPWTLLLENEIYKSANSLRSCFKNFFSPLIFNVLHMKEASVPVF
jgi:hypothetical protein